MQRPCFFISPPVVIVLVMIPALMSGTAAPAANRGGTVGMESPFRLMSSSFGNMQTIPDRYVYNMRPQCSGSNCSPEMSWTGLPAGTKSLAVVMHDPDGGDWTHWVQFNIPPETNRLGEAIGGPGIGVKGSNSFGGTGYAGPCPPSDGRTHRYIFTIYALDAEMNLSAGASRERLEKAMAGHVTGKAVLTGLRKRD